MCRTGWGQWTLQHWRQSLKDPESTNFSFHRQSKMPFFLCAFLSGRGKPDGGRGISIRHHCQARWASLHCPGLPAQQPPGAGSQQSCFHGVTEQSVLGAALWTSALPTQPFLPTSLPQGMCFYSLQQNWAGSAFLFFGPELEAGNSPINYTEKY